MNMTETERTCIHCGQPVIDYWQMGDDMGWVLASGEKGSDDHCDQAGDAAHHAVAAST